MRPVAFQVVLSVLVSAIPATGAVAATFTANNATDLVDADPGDGACTTSVVGACSLRAAIMESNANPGLDRINLGNFSYALTRSGDDDTAMNGDLDILDSVIIAGTGPASTVIDNPEGLVDDRILEVFRCSGNAAPPCTEDAAVVVDIFGVGFRNGEARGSGGSIGNHGTLNLWNVVVSDSRAIDGPGGAIYSDGPLTISECSIRDNRTLAGADGGGVYVANAIATITASTISGNRGLDGGGVYLLNATVSLVNTTISGNLAGLEGGGVRASGGTVGLFNVTITANRSNDVGSTTSGRGGGVSNAGASVTFHNSIISANARLDGDTAIPVQEDCSGTFASAGYNQVTAANPGQCTINGTISVGGALLGPLKDNGGPTRTHALGLGSIGYNAGNPAGCINELGFLLETDQRGEPRPFGAACDLGAFELGDAIFRNGFE